MMTARGRVAAAAATAAAMTVCAAAALLAAEPAGKNYEAISLFGRTLTSPPPDAAALARLEDARRDFEAAPTEDRYIWLGRRTAYTGRYREAIAIYTEGLKRFPDSYRLYRHRGHRYITIRQFTRAIADFEKAADLAAGRPLEVEPDGAPNKAGTPVSNTHFNIYYHLGLAYFLTRDFAKAEAAYQECLRWSKNDDSVVAVTDWLSMTLRRTGRTLDAARAAEPIHGGLTLLENGAYLDRLLMFKGAISEDDFAKPRPGESASEKAIRDYGLGLANLWRGDVARAQASFERVAFKGSWPSFATIAAEVELADLVRRQPDRGTPAAALAAWTLSWNTYDLDLAAALFGTGAGVTYFSSERPGRIEGSDALLEHHRGFGFAPGGKAPDSRLWLDAVLVREEGPAAWITAAWHFDRDVGGSGLVQAGPVTFILVRAPDGWRFVHAHFANDPPSRSQAGAAGSYRR